uniref:Uncharacterized protein n=1 Tax=Molossus molossus TaxID=27622 RepID=A0A7J8JWJ3_MOLMO|nr:hypothetical protein HJG59_007913 [Molossus molossus]
MPDGFGQTHPKVPDALESARWKPTGFPAPESARCTRKCQMETHRVSCTRKCQTHPKVPDGNPPGFLHPKVPDAPKSARLKQIGTNFRTDGNPPVSQVNVEFGVQSTQWIRNMGHREPILAFPEPQEAMQVVAICLK